MILPALPNALQHFVLLSQELGIDPGDTIYTRKQPECSQVEPSSPSFDILGIARMGSRGRAGSRERAKTDRAMEQEALEYCEEVEARLKDKKRRRKANARLRRQKMQQLNFQEFVFLKRVRFGGTSYWQEPPPHYSERGGREKGERSLLSSRPPREGESPTNKVHLQLSILLLQLTICWLHLFPLMFCALGAPSGASLRSSCQAWSFLHLLMLRIKTCTELCLLHCLLGKHLHVSLW